MHYSFQGTKSKCIIARNSLKLDAESPSINREHNHFLVDAHSYKAEGYCEFHLEGLGE
jgi:hypothetical protein